MNDLVQQLTSKVNISREQAEKATEVVMNFIGDRLPDPIAKQVKGALSGEGGALKNLEGLADKLPGGLGDALGGLLGGGGGDDGE